ncbi:hypothetical protein BDD43_2834 [Mucilaginibacter gracilis]|uniref:Uncharacterized protein n=1 Tax=Mucilaginibacter gracilis TaxID=423350 RepID=A0A495J3R5_9SPHI|nr:hypothetical protein [Mucilaginibacter gracilis]RKR82649.1 hypothetical protein BDD43_2834 [Mucilaginibacter gracilis]
MFNIPTLPTDSLYKFMFIGGIVLILFSFFTMNRASDDIKLKRKAADSLSATIRTRNKIDSLKSRWFDRNLNSHIFTTEELKSQIENERKNLIDFISLSDAYEKKALDLIKDEHKIDLISFFMGVLIVVGITFTIVGGCQWYIKIQIPQDRLLQIQLQLAETELKNAKIMHVANTYNRNYIPQKTKKG